MLPSQNREPKPSDHPFSSGENAFVPAFEVIPSLHNVTFAWLTRCLLYHVRDRRIQLSWLVATDLDVRATVPRHLYQSVPPPSAGWIEGGISNIMHVHLSR